MAKVVINISIEPDLLAKIDAAGRERHGGMFSRSAWFSMVAEQALSGEPTEVEYRKGPPLTPESARRRAHQAQPLVRSVVEPQFKGGKK